MGRFLLQLVAKPELWSDLAIAVGVLVVANYPEPWAFGILSGVVTLRIALDVLSASVDSSVLND